MRVLITGGCGFIGVNLIQRLFGRSAVCVRAVDDFSTGKVDDLTTAPTKMVDLNDAADWGADVVGIVEGDVRDEALAFEASKGADVIVHLAASTGVEPSVRDPRKDCLTNVWGTLNYLEAARANNVPRLVFASSGAALGECVPPLHEELAPHVASPYGASKLAGEAYCSAYWRTFGVETVALRFSNVYGPGSHRKDSLVARFTKRVFQGQELTIYGDGSQTRDFIHVSDLTHAIELAATAPAIGGEVFQIATNVETSVQEIVAILDAVWKHAGLSVKGLTHGPPRQGDVRRNYADISKAERLMGWRPEMTLVEGLRQTVRWFGEWYRDTAGQT